MYRTLRVEVGHCGDSPRCGVPEHLSVSKPLTDGVEVGGITWVYANEQFEGVVGLVGDYIIGITGVWFDTLIPLLDEADVIALIEGLRVVPVAELEALDQLQVRDR